MKRTINNTKAQVLHKESPHAQIILCALYSKWVGYLYRQPVRYDGEILYLKLDTKYGLYDGTYWNYSLISYKPQALTMLLNTVARQTELSE